MTKDETLIAEIAENANELYNALLDTDTFETLYGQTIADEEYDELMALLQRMSKATPK